MSPHSLALLALSAAIKRGVQLTSRSRPLVAADLNRFDYIIGMDPSNIRAILRAAGYWAENDKQLPDLEQVSRLWEGGCPFCQVI